jgi:hypothetical protein
VRGGWPKGALRQRRVALEASDEQEEALPESWLLRERM